MITVLFLNHNCWSQSHFLRCEDVSIRLVSNTGDRDLQTTLALAGGLTLLQPR